MPYTQRYGYNTGAFLYFNGSSVDTNVTKAIGGTAFGASWVQYLKGSTWIIRDSWGSVESFRAPATATAVTRNYVMGLQVVLPDGEVMFTGNKCVKDVAGYSLKDLFIGVPIIWTEQYKRGLGDPVPAIKAAVESTRSMRRRVCCS